MPRDPISDDALLTAARETLKASSHLCALLKRAQGMTPKPEARDAIVATYLELEGILGLVQQDVADAAWMVEAMQERMG